MADLQSTTLHKHIFAGNIANKLELGRLQMEFELSENLPRGPWTNEKHLHYLNSVEASFVRTMFQKNAVHRTLQLRLDRYLPDSSDSTLDLKSRARKTHLNSSSGDIGVGATRNRVHRRSRRLLHLPTQDQVVPQLEDRSGDKVKETIVAM